jgi:hypothetical protein
MDPYVTRGQARIHHRDIHTLVRTHGFLTPAVLAALERQRGWQAVVEWNGLLQQVGVKTPTAASLVAWLRQVIVAALIRVGERLAAGPPSGASPGTASLASMGDTAR